MSKYAVGIDYGTLSARAVLVDLTTGREMASSEYVYPHGVLPADYFEGITLKKSTALQHPQDYLDALRLTLHEVLTQTGVSTQDIVGLGIDFTACTVLPLTADGTPLCFLEAFQNNPHAYVKLWKHHGAQEEADAITALAQKRKESWLPIYGNKISSEWLFPKLLEIIHKAPEVFAQTVYYMEAADWLVWQITGVRAGNSSLAGLKGLWNKKDGYPSNGFWKEVHPALSNVIGTLVTDQVVPTGTKVGEIHAEGAVLTGLAPGTAVTAPIIDAHAALPAAGVVEEGQLLMILGTSGAYITMSCDEKQVEHIGGRVVDGIVPGYTAYDAGLNCVGDSFDWFVKNGVPEKYALEAREKGIPVFRLLREKAGQLQPGESGILVLDWWNGNRTPLEDSQLTGVILGLTVQTKPEEIYRGMIEASAFGAKTILNLYEQYGVHITELYAAGGISQKDPLLMQIYADVFGKPIQVTASKQAGAKGSAVLASVAGGYFASVKEAAAVIADPCCAIYTPNVENTEKYQKLYEEYHRLTKYFGCGGNDVMKRLKRL